MKFAFDGTPLALSNEVKVGDVYPAKGRDPTIMWVVLAVTNYGRTAHALGVDMFGQVCSTASYAVHAFKCRERIGTAKGLDALSFEIEFTIGGQLKVRQFKQVP